MNSGLKSQVSVERGIGSVKGKTAIFSDIRA
jgi:hypothetical protein